MGRRRLKHLPVKERLLDAKRWQRQKMLNHKDCFGIDLGRI